MGLLWLFCARRDGAKAAVAAATCLALSSLVSCGGTTTLANTTKAGAAVPRADGKTDRLKFGFDQYAIRVFDLDRSVTFYTEAFGLRVIKQVRPLSGNFIGVMLGYDKTPFVIELLWFKKRKTPYDLPPNMPLGQWHLGLAVNDYEAAFEKHKKMGLKLKQFHWQRYDCHFIQDPDGYWVEVLPMGITRSHGHH